MYKFIFILNIILSIFISKDCDKGNKIIEDLLNNDSLKVFFEKKDKILISNFPNKCKNEIINGKKIEFTNKKLKCKSIYFNKLHIENNELIVEIYLFSNNSIYEAKYKILNNSELKLINNNLTQIRQENDCF